MEEISGYVSKFKEEFEGLSCKVEKGILRIEMKIEQAKSDLIKWLVSLFVILALMVPGLYAKK